MRVPPCVFMSLKKRGKVGRERENEYVFICVFEEGGRGRKRKRRGCLYVCLCVCECLQKVGGGEERWGLIYIYVSLKRRWREKKR